MIEVYKNSIETKDGRYFVKITENPEQTMNGFVPSAMRFVQERNLANYACTVGDGDFLLELFREIPDLPEEPKYLGMILGAMLRKDGLGVIGIMKDHNCSIPNSELPTPSEESLESWLGKHFPVDEVLKITYDKIRLKFPAFSKFSR